jgi:hypothetical protein
MTEIEQAIFKILASQGQFIFELAVAQNDLAKEMAIYLPGLTAPEREERLIRLEQSRLQVQKFQDSVKRLKGVL